MTKTRLPTVIHLKFQNLSSIEKIDFELNLQIKQKITQPKNKLECYDLFSVAKSINSYTTTIIKLGQKLDC